MHLSERSFDIGISKMSIYKLNLCERLSRDIIWRARLHSELARIEVVGRTASSQCSMTSGPWPGSNFLAFREDCLLARHITIQSVPRSLHIEHGDKGRLFEIMVLKGKSHALFAERQQSHERFLSSNSRWLPLTREVI
jgi:hypothetical protein